MSDNTEKSNRYFLDGILIVLIYAAIIGVLVFTHTWGFESSQNSLTWVQPEHNEKKPPIIPSDFNINIWKIEKSLGKISFDDNGKVKLNTVTANILKNTVNHLLHELTPDHISQTRFLIKQIHPQYNTSQLADIVINYRKYALIASQQAEQKNHSGNVDDAEIGFKNDTLLKERFLGKNISDALFHEKNAMAMFVFESKRILKKPSLSSIEKEKILYILAKKLKS